MHLTLHRWANHKQTIILILPLCCGCAPYKLVPFSPCSSCAAVAVKKVLPRTRRNANRGQQGSGSGGAGNFPSVGSGGGSGGIQHSTNSKPALGPAISPSTALVPTGGPILPGSAGRTIAPPGPGLQPIASININMHRGMGSESMSMSSGTGSVNSSLAGSMAGSMAGSYFSSFFRSAYSSVGPLNCKTKTFGDSRDAGICLIL